MTLSRTPPRWTLPALLLLAVGVRLLCWARALMMMNDGVDFLWQAERLLAGDLDAVLAHPYHPLYGALSAAASLLTGDVLSGALAVSIGSGLALVGTTWWLARRLLPDEPWLPPAAALVAAISARAIQYGGDIQSDGLAAALWMLALAALLAAARAERPLRALALAGVFTGLGYLTRPEMLAATLPALVLVARRPDARARIAAALGYGLPLLALVLPYVLAMHAATGVWGLSLKPALQIPGDAGKRYIHQAPADSPLGAPIVFRDRVQAPRRLPTGDARRALEAATDSDAPAVAPSAETKDASMLSLPLGARDAGVTEAGRRTLDDLLHAARVELLLLAIFGIAALWRRSSRVIGATSLALGTWLGVAFAQHALNGYLTNRHMLPALVVLFPVAGMGVLVLARAGRSALSPSADAAGSASTRLGLRGWLARLLLTLALLESVRAGTEAQRDDHGGRLEALRWLTTQTEPHERFATHRRRDGFYAQRPVMICALPVNEAVLRRTLAESNTRWMVFDERRLHPWHSDWFERGLVEEVARFGEGEDVALVLRAHFGD